jgi:hypothetical protein
VLQKFVSWFFSIFRWTPSTTPAPLGSQLAVGSLVPERAGLEETGQMIPLHLFPIETQNKILEIEEATTKDPEKYVDSSSFEISGCALWALLTQSTNTLKLPYPSHIPPVSGFEPGTFGVRSRHSTNELLSNSESCCSETVPV